MEGIHAILGAVALLIVTVALILGLTILVLLEARWALRLAVDLYGRWRASIRQLRDAGFQDHPSPRRGGRPPGHGGTPGFARPKED